MFKKIKFDGKELVAIKEVIGKSTTSKHQKVIASYLQLKDPLKYPSHRFQRSSISMIAEVELSAQQMKTVSGHKIDNVLQEYMDNMDMH